MRRTPISSRSGRCRWPALSTRSRTKAVTRALAPTGASYRVSPGSWPDFAQNDHLGLTIAPPAVAGRDNAAACGPSHLIRRSMTSVRYVRPTARRSLCCAVQVLLWHRCGQTSGSAHWRPSSQGPRRRSRKVSGRRRLPPCEAVQIDYLRAAECCGGSRGGCAQINQIVRRGDQRGMLLAVQLGGLVLAPACGPLQSGLTEDFADARRAALWVPGEGGSR